MNGCPEIRFRCRSVISLSTRVRVRVHVCNLLIYSFACLFPLLFIYLFIIYLFAYDFKYLLISLFNLLIFVCICLLLDYLLGFSHVYFFARALICSCVYLFASVYAYFFVCVLYVYFYVCIFIYLFIYLRDAGEVRTECGD
jgi:hypothetical protein